MSGLRCQECRMGLLHWHCPGCGTAVQDYGRRCLWCRPATEGWVGMAVVLVAVALWGTAFYMAHDVIQSVIARFF